MAANLHILVACLALILGFVLCIQAAPKPLSESQPRHIKGVSDKFANFLSQDKEFGKFLEDPRSVLGTQFDGVRTKREARPQENFDEGDYAPPDQQGPKKPGFFDRAAKFVMELLQRFLKWVNADEE